MTSYTIYRCPVDGQLYAEVPGLAVHPGLAAVRYYATSPHSPVAKRRRFWVRVLRAMERQAASATSPDPGDPPIPPAHRAKRRGTPPPAK